MALPPTLRQANTTFVNLRAALDDLTPLVNEAKPATKDLTPFLRNLRQVSERGVPVIHNLSLAINRPGPNNDITESLRAQPRATRAADRTVPNAIEGLNASQPVITFARPYAPDLFSWIAKFDAGRVLLRLERPLRAGLHRRVESVHLLHRRRHESRLRRSRTRLP